MNSKQENCKTNSQQMMALNPGCFCLCSVLCTQILPVC